ncbi:MAG TPA: thioredoxin family protein [Thermoanaerobaculia bacterium]|nr:thioredoxin family protein [Thermoanaerobaculia bacterium]
MNPLSKDLWERGLLYKDYRRTVRRNGKTFDEVFRDPTHEDADLAFLRQLPPLRVLAIGEDWCPDVYHTLPTWVRIADELPGWQLRIFSRDAHPDLMRFFLWRKDAQRIPVYAFYDDEDRLQTWWSGRSATAQRAFDESLGGRPFSKLDPEERKRVSDAFEEGYRREFRRANLEEILALLSAFFHLSPREEQGLLEEGAGEAVAAEEAGAP